MYKVFIDKSCLLFKKNEKFSTNVEEKYQPSLRTKQFKSFSELLSSWNQEEPPFVADASPLDRMRLFFKEFVWIEAAGGVVKNASTGQFLFIHRLGTWDLPKGKIEKHETIEEAAIREVQEECGLQNLTIIRRLPDTYHSYHAYGKYWIKKTYWFEMETAQIETTPQKEEEIHSAEWFANGAINEIMKDTYPSLIDVIKEAIPIND